MGPKKLPPAVLMLVRGALLGHLRDLRAYPTIATWVVRRVAYDAVCFREDSDIAACEGRAFLATLVIGLVVGRSVATQLATDPAPAPETMLAEWGHDLEAIQRDFWTLSHCLIVALGKLIPTPGVSAPLSIEFW